MHLKLFSKSCKCNAYLYVNSGLYLPYLFEYNAQNFVRNFNQKLRYTLYTSFFISTLYFYFFFWTLI